VSLTLGGDQEPPVEAALPTLAAPKRRDDQAYLRNLRGRRHSKHPSQQVSWKATPMLYAKRAGSTKVILVAIQVRQTHGWVQIMPRIS